MKANENLVDLVEANVAIQPRPIASRSLISWLKTKKHHGNLVVKNYVEVTSNVNYSRKTSSNFLQ